MTEEEKNELESKIFKEIEKLERKKPILLIGKDKELIQNAVRRIHSTHPKVDSFVTSVPSPFESSDDLITYLDSFSEIKLREYSCIGKTETEIEHKLFLPKNLIGYYKNGDTFFVRGLNIPRILERLADSVEGYCSGVLIINVPSMDIVPQELLDQFEPIYLEPKKKDASKKLRGRKSHYANQEKYLNFLKDINKKYSKCTLGKKAQMAISQMEGRKMFLDNKGKPCYAKSTIRKQLSKLGK